MKKNLYAATAIMIAMLAASATQAQSPQGQGMGKEGGMQAEQDPQAIANRKAEEELALKNRKAEILLHLTHRMEELQKKQSCIQSASTQEAFQKCLPDMGGPGPGKHHGMKMGKPNGQQGKDAPGGGTVNQ